MEPADSGGLTKERIFMGEVLIRGYFKGIEKNENKNGEIFFNPHILLRAMMEEEGSHNF